MTMHMLPVYYTTTNTRKRKAKKKTKGQLAAEREHEKFLKKMGIGSRSSVGIEQRSSKPWVAGSSPAESAKSSPIKSGGFGIGYHPSMGKSDTTYKKEISSKYVIGQTYNKGNYQVLSKKDQADPATGKRR